MILEAISETGQRCVELSADWLQVDDSLENRLAILKMETRP